jgi:hypothetical protein
MGNEPKELSNVQHFEMNKAKMDTFLKLVIKRQRALLKN